jgi:methylglutaconyl-CoA hydratase
MLSSLPIPSISAVSAVAVGGGLELALACTLRVFASSAVVGFPENRLGVIPGAGGTYRLRNLIGESRAMYMILTGCRVSAPRAWRLGMCERLVDVDHLPTDDGKNGGNRRRREIALEEAMETAVEICKSAPLSTLAAMKAIRGGNEQAENEAYESVMDTEDRVEALHAWKVKEMPVFQGR